ncbi:hypothetical protein [Pseudoalteromonas phage PH357]|nr:hypothetical protein [Pseudoalteromonas phage PH357]
MFKLYIFKFLTSLLKLKPLENSPYKSTRIGERGCLYTDPNEVSKDMEDSGLYERGEKLVNKGTNYDY